jgi:hypothetical protein
MTDNAAEIAKIEHELEILRTRYATFERWAKVAKWFVIGVAVIVSATIIGYGLIHDLLVAVLMIFVIVVIAAAFYLTGDYRNLRWIDGISHPPGWPREIGWFPYRGPASEAIAIESMIAGREARLAELKGLRQ